MLFIFYLASTSLYLARTGALTCSYLPLHLRDTVQQWWGFWLTLAGGSYTIAPSLCSLLHSPSVILSPLLLLLLFVTIISFTAIDFVTILRVYDGADCVTDVIKLFDTSWF